MDTNSFQQRLKAIYSQQDKIPPLIEGVEDLPEYNIREHYVKLQTVIKEDTPQQTDIEIRNIFDKTNDNQKEAPTKLLILGGAGVGKTALFQYITYKWSQGELWADKFDYIYRVSLKSIVNPNWRHEYTKENQETDLLKCVVHRALSDIFFYTKDEELRFQEIDWPDTKERVLLLLDDYDEITHVKSDKSRRDLRQLFQKIFSHQYVIFASRPNAVDEDMKRNFHRIIENKGLDDEGIRQFIAKYFENNPQDKELLDKLISKNAPMRVICKVPVNLAILCYSHGHSKSKTVGDTTTSIAGLYRHFFRHLGKRYFAAKKWRGNTEERKTLKEQFDNAELDMDEMKVLKHVAYNALTGGGIGVEDTARRETLIIPGAFRGQNGVAKKNDEEGISLQSSINFLARINAFQQKPKVNINEVYKYGVLRVEGRTTKGSEETKQEDEETNLWAQDYSFIHISFQEYLAALYFKDMLDNKNPDVKTQVCQFLAENRNQPRYLMTLKFLAGIVAADRRAVAEETAKIFWDAMTCNVDGIIELGVKTKVSLIMDLLGQATIDGKLDERIPNKQEMTELVDAVVLNDMHYWETQLKESGYILENGSTATAKASRNEQLREIQEKSSSVAIKDAIQMMWGETESTTRPGQNDEEMSQMVAKCNAILDQEKELEDAELEWINENFGALASLSSEGRALFNRLYHKMLEDEKITESEHKIIIKYINYGLTTCISRNGEVIFEGKKYKVADPNVDTIIEEIARTTLLLTTDALAPQCKLHKPIFPKSHISGMKPAAIDVDQVESVVEKAFILSSDGYVLSQLHNETENIIMLEQRNALGDHMIYYFDFANRKYELLRINPANDNKTCKREQLEKVFGRYKPNCKYMGKSKQLSTEKAQIIITGNLSEFEELVKNQSGQEEKEKEYFQQELLGLGNSDKINDIYKIQRVNKMIEQKLLNPILKKRSMKKLPTEENTTEEDSTLTGVTKTEVKPTVGLAQGVIPEFQPPSGEDEARKCCCNMF